jgi:hypothetical protein
MHSVGVVWPSYGVMDIWWRDDDRLDVNRLWLCNHRLDVNWSVRAWAYTMLVNSYGNMGTFGEMDSEFSCITKRGTILAQNIDLALLESSLRGNFTL